MDTTQSADAVSQAIRQYEYIEEMTTLLDDEDEDKLEKARETIQEHPLEVAVRSDWVKPGSESFKPSEYKILLCTGGPAVRIVGDLDDYSSPSSARLECQDWGTPWTECREAEEQILLQYAQCFFYGE